MTEMAQVKVEGQTVEVLSESGGPPCARPLAAPKHPIMRVRVMATYMVLLLRLVLPALVAACRALLRNQRCVRERVVPAVFAFIANSISLSSLSGKPSSEESLLGPEASPGAAAAEAAVAVEPVLERSVTCNVLFDPGDAARRADVIFIHGLHGSLEKTWRQGSWREGPAIQPLPLRRSPPTPPPELLDAVFSSAPEQLCQQDEDEEEEEEAGRPPPPPRAPTPPHSAARPPAELYSDCWPRDWLPQDCPGLRVIALNYTTDPFLWRPLWMSKRHRTNMLQRGREMMEHLQEIGVGKHPIIWVGHSKGGLFVKQMIVDAFENGGEPLAGIYQNTKAIMFYSVPHMGSACADINLPLLRQSVELTEVQKDCREVLELHSKFLSLVEQKHLQAEVFSFIETIPTFMRILYIQIVSLESADAAIGQLFGAPLDHRNICKPTNRQCFLYKELINLIQKHL